MVSEPTEPGRPRPDFAVFAKYNFEMDRNFSVLKKLLTV
jgi:hypothetical protein